MIVLDTSLLVAHLNPHDRHHQAAADIMTQFLEGEWGDGVLLEYVFLELVTVIQVRIDHGTAVRVADQMMAAAELVFIPCSDVFLPSLETFRAEGQRGLSFADAAVVTVARKVADGRVGTFDRGFEGVGGVSVIPAVAGPDG